MNWVQTTENNFRGGIESEGKRKREVNNYSKRIYGYNRSDVGGMSMCAQI